MRRPFVFVAWCLATAGAGALAWTAVDQVAARVTDHTPVVGESSIRAALRAGSRNASEDARASVRPGQPGEPAAGNGGVSGAGAGTSPVNPAGTSNASRTAGTNGSTGGATGPSSSPPASGGNPAPPPPAPAPTTTTTSPAPPQNASILVIGGSVTASCASGTPTLIAAIPTNGFGVAVSRGTQLLVDFTSSTHHSIVEAECSDGQIQWSTGEEAAN